MRPSPLARTLATLGASVALLPSGAAAQASDAWQFGASLYVYLPSVDGKTTFPQGPAAVEASNLLDSLKGAFMGTFEARRGVWGGFTDIAYFNFGNSKSGTRDLSIGGVPLPVDVSASADLDLKGAAWTFAATYRAVPDPASPLDVFAGARLLDLKEKLTWQLSGNIGQFPVAGQAGSQEVNARNWDAIVGVKGRLDIGAERKWFVPYYVDVGTGESKFTWQATGGIGYSFGSFEIVGSWRYLDYHMKSGRPIESVRFSGPAVAAAFRW